MSRSGDNAPNDEQGRTLTTAVSTVMERLLALAREDARLRSDLRHLAETFLIELDAPGSSEESDADSETRRDIEEEADSGTSEPEEIVTPQEVAAALATNQPFSDDDGRPERSSAKGFASRVADEELPEIEKRCRLKSEAARWAKLRKEHDVAGGSGDGSTILAQHGRLISRAKELPDCFLWMCSSEGPSPSDPGSWEELARCFEALADAIELTVSLIDARAKDQPFFETGLNMMAEAHSALRVMVSEIGASRNDSDQSKVHEWLRETGLKNGIHLRRHMRLSDPANPANMEELQHRIAEVREQWRSVRDKERQRRDAINKVNYHARLIATRKAVNPEHDWRKIAEAVEDLIQNGVPPSDADLRQVLLPIIEEVPNEQDWPDGFELMLREINRYLASRPTSDAPSAEESPSPEVEQARELLQGRILLLIGGARRSQIQRKLENAFGLHELRWMTATSHESPDKFASQISHPDVALVVLAIKDTSYQLRKVKQACQCHGKPLARLPSGYGINRIAREILHQCSEQLRSA